MVVFVSLTVPQSSALSCAIPPFAESYDRHDLLLHGKLVEKELLHPESENQKTTDLTFDTIKVYKGEFSKTITVKANLSWDDYYQEGEMYVVFADKDGDSYLRELCVADYVSSPSIIKFLDEFLLDPTIGDDVLSLYDVVQGFERDDLDIRINNYSSLNRGEISVPEPDDNPHLEEESFCGKGATYHEGICIVDQPDDESNGSTGKWGTLEYPVSPLKQIKNGVALVDVKCNEGKVPSYKGDRMRVACVSEETQSELWIRGWATMRLISPEENISHALCNNYEGKWHPEYDGCREVSDLQCSLMGGKFVDNLEICYNEICPDDKTYTLCVTNPEIWDDTASVGNWISDEDYCGDWCDQNELYQLGCDKPILSHLAKYSNLLSEEFDGTFKIEDTGLPDGITVEKFEECVDIIYEKRVTVESEKKPSQ